MYRIVLFILLLQHTTNAFKFSVIGDTGTGSHSQYQIARELEKHDVDFVIHVGDLIYPLGYENEKGASKKLFAPYKNINVPFFSIMGNHDSRINSDALLKGLEGHRKFYLPERFYSIELGRIKFIMIDSMILGEDAFWSGTSEWSKESGYKFIEKELNTNKDVVIVAHYPFYSISKHGSQLHVAKKVQTLDINNKIRMVLSGHSHVLEFIQHNGINQIISGSGAKVDRGEPFKHQFEEHERKFIHHALGLVIIEYKDNVFIVQFINHLGKILFTTTL